MAYDPLDVDWLPQLRFTSWGSWLNELDFVYVDALCVQETAKALGMVFLSAKVEEPLRRPDEGPIWVPKSHIHPDSQIQAPGDRGKLTVTRWVAEKKGGWPAAERYKQPEVVQHARQMVDEMMALIGERDDVAVAVCRQMHIACIQLLARKRTQRKKTR